MFSLTKDKSFDLKKTSDAIANIRHLEGIIKDIASQGFPASSTLRMLHTIKESQRQRIKYQNWEV